jgi:hypothetical protein
MPTTRTLPDLCPIPSQPCPSHLARTLPDPFPNPRKTSPGHRAGTLPSPAPPSGGRARIRQTPPALPATTTTATTEPCPTPAHRTAHG